MGGRDFICKDGTTISKGSFCFLPHMVLHRNGKIFKDPDCFDPERWESSDVKEMRDSLFTFSLGRRSCIGKPLAVAQFNTIIPRILSKFKFDVEKDGELRFF